MVSVLTLLLMVLCADDAHLEQGRQLKLEGRLLMAESHFLRADPDESQLGPLARDLCDIALRSNGNTMSRRNFYRSYLTRSRSWRGTAALVLAGLNYQMRDFTAFKDVAELYIKEFPGDDPVRFHLIYHLARHSRVSQESLRLSGDEAELFKAARTLEPHKDLPNLEATSLPYFYRYLSRLESGEIAPAPDPEATETDQYLYQLTRLRKAMSRYDEAEAAAALNTIYAFRESVDRPDLDIYYYNHLQEFFFRRNEVEDAKVVAENLKLIRDWTYLPIEGLPAFMDVPKTKLAPPKPDLPTEPEQTIPLETKEDTLEEAVWAGRRGLELTIRKLPTDTTYQKIFRNYLLGTFHLKGGRFEDAYDRLRVAEGQVVEFPFPNLEAKIFMALADYHQAKDYSEKADWYRLQALQIEKTPRFMPLIQRDGQFHYPASAVLIDMILSQSNASQQVSRLIFYHEQLQFSRQMARAYQRNVLLENPLVGQQLHQIGDQLATQVDSLATNPAHQENPSLYNNTLELWNELWSQSLPYYQQEDMPEQETLQGLLNSRDRIVSFIEGRTRLGVVILSNEQALALSLGTKIGFSQMSPEARIQFLEARLGPIWNQDGRLEGQLLLTMSPYYRQEGLLDVIVDKLKNPQKMKVFGSLKAMTTIKQRGQCEDLVVWGDDADLRPDAKDLYSLENLNSQSFERGLEDHDHVLYRGPILNSNAGLSLGPAENGLFFHQIVHYNPLLCSLTVVATTDIPFGILLDEFELLNPSASTSITIMSDPTPAKTLELGKTGAGMIFLP